MDATQLVSEIKRRESVNHHAVSWKVKLEAALNSGLFYDLNTQPNGSGPMQIGIDPEINLIPTITINLKDAELSELYMREGDVYFEQEEYLIAYKRYTQCITHASAGSHSLAMFYATRAIALFNGNYMSDCLIDLERAIQHGYPNSLKSNLYMLKAVTMIELKMKKTLIKRAINQARRWLPSVNNDQEKKGIKQRIESLNLPKTQKLDCYKHDFKDAALPPLKSRNPIVPGLSNSVGLKYSEEYGRHIVATQDIQAGDVIGIQKPYASVVKMNLRYSVCWHCKKQTWASIACDTCSQVVFCSKNCKRQAQLDYHDIECLVMCQIMAFGIMSDHVVLALRLIIMALKENNNSLDKLVKTVHEIDNSTDPLTKGFIKGKLDPTKFKSVYGLCDPTSSSTVNKKSSSFADAFVMSYFLCKKIEFFQESCTIDCLSYLMSNGTFPWLVEIITKLMDLTFYQSFNITQSSSGMDVSIALSIIPSLSFFNRSFDSNVIRDYDKESLIITAIHQIKKGEQLYDASCYNPRWFKHKKASFNDLTSNCIAKVFSFLNIQDKLNSEAVCLKWKNISKKGWNNIKTLDITYNPCFMDGDPSSQDVVLQTIIIRCGKSLSQLAINDKCSQRTIDTIAKECINISDIYIFIYDDNKDLSRLLQNMVKLQKLSIHVMNQKNFNDNIFQNANRTIESFAMSIDANNDYIGSNNFALMLMQCYNLQFLYLMNVKIDENFDLVIPTLKKNLKSFINIKTVFLYEDLHFEILEQLEELDTSQMLQIDNTCLKNYSVHLKNLTTLNVHGCISINDIGFSYISNFENLYSLNVGSTSITDKALLNFVSLKRLLEFDCNNTKVTDIGVVSVLKNSLQLFFLNVQKTGVTYFTLIEASNILNNDKNDREIVIVINDELKLNIENLSAKINFSQY